MFRSSLIVAGAALLCSTALAQQQVDPARRIPVNVPIKNAGTLDISTGKWTPPSATSKKAVQVVFNNTCTWTTAAYYAGFGECESSYDEGRVPSKTSPGAPPTATNSQVMTSFQIAYCVYNATTTAGVNMEIAFWDKLNGNCIGGVPVSTQSWSSIATAYFDLSGAGLPGSTANGFQACWIVTIDTTNSGWTMASDGEGTFDNIEAEDKFIWGKRINDQTPGGANGFLLSGDPNFAAPGTCSYAIPCKTDVFSGQLCGTGLGVWDGNWINVDNVAPGSPNLPPAPCLPGVAAYGYGTNCYFFGGYPTNVLDSYWLVLEGDGGGGGAAKFCTSKPSSLAGCVPTLTGSGTSISKAGGSYTCVATPVPGGGAKPGIVIWTKAGLLANPVNTNFGFLCLFQFNRFGAWPAAQGGTTGLCNGTYNFAVQTAVTNTASIAAGNTLHLQAWYRDPGFPPPGNANFTNGIGPITVTP